MNFVVMNFMKSIFHGKTVCYYSIEFGFIATKALKLTKLLRRDLTEFDDSLDFRSFSSFHVSFK